MGKRSDSEEMDTNGQVNGKENDSKIKRKFTEDEDDDSEDKGAENGSRENGQEEAKSGRSSRNSRSRSGEKPEETQDNEEKEESKEIEIKKKDESITTKRNYRSNREDSTDSDVDFKRGEKKRPGVKRSTGGGKKEIEKIEGGERERGKGK